MVLLVLAAFGPTLRVGFLWDDHEMIEKNPHITTVSWTNLKHAFGHDVFDGKGDAYYRPLQTLMNMVDYHLWGLRPLGFHLTNLYFHLWAACLLFSVLGLLLNEKRIAFLASAFFAVHPVIVEQLLIIAGRAELMSAAFMLAGLRAALEKTPRGTALSLTAYVLACLSKESGVILPVFLFLAGVPNPRYRFPWKAYLPYGAIFLGYVFLRKSAVGSGVPLPDLGVLAKSLVQDFPTIAVTYLGLLLVPTDLHSHHRMLFHYRWMVLSPLLIALFVALAAVKGSRVLTFSLGWFFTGLLPKVPILATNSLMLDHWVYLSGVGVYIALAQGIDLLLKRNGEPRVLGTLAAVGLVFFWVGIGWQNIKGRKTDRELYLWALRYPTSSVVRFNLGLLYLQERSYPRALELFEESYRMNPHPMTKRALDITKLRLEITARSPAQPSRSSWP